MTTPLQLYWQPGCTSCLRTREFLREHAIAFESINVRTDVAAFASLRDRGLRTVPVLCRGPDYVLAQDLDEVARFVGIRLEREQLSPALLLQRLDALLDAAEQLTYQLPPERMRERLPQRERSWLDLAYHIPMIVAAYLAAARGGVLTYQHYELTPPAALQNPTAIGAVTAQLRAQLRAWAQSNASDERLGDRPLETYFGVRSLQIVLERTTWHVAQHCRQLEHLVQSSVDPAPESRLGQTILAGLPLPAAIWDPEVTDA